jgi:hypothetical protein
VTNAVVFTRFVVVPGTRTKRCHHGIQVVQILAPDVFVDDIHPGLEAGRSHQHAVIFGRSGAVKQALVPQFQICSLQV